ncbi:MAG: cysteine desulfurase [Proteobacteria bacterium]|nr:cysteine desulfurase [Pseudomonadota bacterium]NBP15849.1 cysteine desulfurase [bacterium]
MIYLDNNATTRLDSKIIEEAPDFLKDFWGNPSSSYKFGSRLRNVIDEAREFLSEVIKAPFESFIFTSGASESISTAISTACLLNAKKRHIVTSNVEHSAVLNTFKALDKHGQGYEFSYINVDSDGRINIEEIIKSIRNDTCLVSFMSANNETGVLFPCHEISKVCKQKNVFFLCDTTQSMMKEDLNIADLGCDFAVFSAHKTGGPKGVGGLYVKKGIPLRPLIYGGHQENSRRGGTENVFGIWAWATAIKSIIQGVHKRRESVKKLRDRFENRVLEAYKGAEVNGTRENRLCNTTNIYFPGIENSAFLILLDQNGVLASSGSACLADSSEPSHVINAMRGSIIANQSVRFSLSLSTTEDEILSAAEIVLRVARELNF